MGLQEIRELAAKLTARLADAPDEVGFQQAGRLENLLEELDLESDPPAGPGFVCLPIEAHDRLRATAERAEEAEARAREPEKLTGREHRRANRAEAKPAGRQEWSEVGPEERKRAAAEWRLQCDLEKLREERPDPARFPIAPPPGREGDRIEPYTMGPMHVATRIMADPVVHNHLRDLQGEIDGLKDRLEEICRQHQGLNARLAALEDVGGFPVGDEFAAFKTRLDDLSDRLHALVARMNKAEAQMKPRPVETSVTPFTNAPA